MDECDVRELRTIKRNYPTNSNLCCTEMFDLWHRRYTSASWVDLINALNAVQLNNVAENVTQFCEKMTQLYGTYEFNNSYNYDCKNVSAISAYFKNQAI